MRNSLRAFAPWSLAAAMTAGLQCGCASDQSRGGSFWSKDPPCVEVTSYRDPYFPQRITLSFDECVFGYDAGGDLHAVGRLRRSTSATDSGYVDEYVYVHMFWKPNTGRTVSHSSTSNAVVKYVVLSDTGVASYSGTGFVFPKKRWDGRLALLIEEAGLGVEKTRGETGELLGNVRVTGEMVASEFPTRRVALEREIEIQLDRPLSATSAGGPAPPTVP